MWKSSVHTRRRRKLIIYRQHHVYIMFVATLGLVSLIKIYNTSDNSLRAQRLIIISIFSRTNRGLINSNHKRIFIILLTGSIRNSPPWIARSCRRSSRQTRISRPCHKRRRRPSSTATSVHLDHQSSKTIRSINRWPPTSPIST